MVWKGTIVGSSIFGKHVVVTVTFLLDYSRKKIGQMTVLRELGLLTGMTRSTFQIAPESGHMVLFVN